MNIESIHDSVVVVGEEPRELLVPQQLKKGARDTGALSKDSSGVSATPGTSWRASHSCHGLWRRPRRRDWLLQVGRMLDRTVNFFRRSPRRCARSRSRAAASRSEHVDDMWGSLGRVRTAQVLHPDNVVLVRVPSLSSAGRRLLRQNVSGLFPVVLVLIELVLMR